MEALGLDAYEARIFFIDPMQVTGEDGKPGAMLVGGSIDNNVVRILTPRGLDEEDIVHELLHFVRPESDHQQIVIETRELIIARNLKIFPLKKLLWNFFRKNGSLIF